MADRNGNNTDGAAPSDVRVEKNRKPNWLAWALLALGLLALLFGLSRCGDRHADERSAAITNSDGAVAGTPNAPAATALAGTSTLGSYLAGSQAAPQTFTFDKLNFETAKSAIRSADQADVDAVAAALTKYPATQVRIAGYADTRGSEAANAALGKARADSVKAALVAKGIDAGRIETVTGGTSDPVDSNATAAGRAENRRTELVVTRR